jgi:hypothetical protein
MRVQNLQMLHPTFQIYIYIGMDEYILVTRKIYLLLVELLEMKMAPPTIDLLKSEIPFEQEKMVV